MNVKILRQLDQRRLALGRGNRHFLFECRALVPAWSFCHGLSLDCDVMPPLRRKSTYPTCSVFQSHLSFPTLPSGKILSDLNWLAFKLTPVWFPRCSVSPNLVMVHIGFALGLNFNATKKYRESEAHRFCIMEGPKDIFQLVARYFRSEHDDKGKLECTIDGLSNEAHLWLKKIFIIIPGGKN